jgi:dienelactone hydrolase
MMRDVPESPEAAARAALDLIQAARFEEIREMFAEQLRPLVSAGVLRTAWEGAVVGLGPVVSVGEPVTESTPAGPAVVKLPVRFAHDGLTLVVTVTGAGKLAGLQIAPKDEAAPAAPWEPPGYADPERFAEEDVTVGAGPLAVGGTLSVPRLPGPLPAIVLLAGSGPQDRDETIGGNKPLKDVAWGLATRGVVVLRFDKVTHALPAAVRDAQDFTVVDEYVHHAVAAVELLGRHPAVDADRVFVLGHSMGGTVAPRVAAAEPSVAGLVIMAGSVQPLQWAIVRQVRYLASLDPAAAAQSEPAIEAMTEQAKRVDSPDLSPSTPPAELPFGVPAAYWLDLRAYDQVAVAAALGKPMLILQGARDYQVTVADDLALWQAGLAGRPGVTFRVYPSANHLFFPGSGPPTRTEYGPAQHVDPQVVADVAAWLRGED